MGTIPLGYLITFRTYGTWLHGDWRGSVDRRHRTPRTALLPPRPGLATAERRQLRHEQIFLDVPRRAVVASSLEETCRHHAWLLHAMSVRTEHVHVVVSLSGETPPERIMTSMKAWATRRMVEGGLVLPGMKPWSRHGSTRYLWTETALVSACRYVLEGQGAPL